VRFSALELQARSAAQSGIAALAAQYRSDIQSYYTLSNASQLQFGMTESGAPTVGGIVPYLFTVDDYLTWFESGAGNVEYQELHSGVYQGSSSNTAYGPWYGVQFASTIARVGDQLVSASNPAESVDRSGRSAGHTGARCNRARLRFEVRGYAADLLRHSRSVRTRRLYR
jgi:hypothetical protein